MQPQWWLLAAVVVAVFDVKVGFITDKIDHEKNLHLGALPAWQAGRCTRQCIAACLTYPA